MRTKREWVEIHPRSRSFVPFPTRLVWYHAGKCKELCLCRLSGALGVPQ
ncbi:hypothetical protein FHT76_004631 [Rhizobium sp. BK176]|nr:hypothetical protein [Rhizobium sp. BK181]MBB3542246.1 hypothetical protein [Rhizobium sp. BK399]MCS3738105.1 hypothetical protein [Rhizobium sp. BK661]MCS4092953.1 hypothetical protein [Rhizobium sp. BK176]